MDPLGVHEQALQMLQPLAADVLLPRGLAAEERIPALVSQTRYWRSSELRAPFKWFVEPHSLDAYRKDLLPFFTGHGYALVLVDVRGTGASFGEWPHPWPDASTHDVADLAEWIVSQPWSNGRIGGYGVSYLGTTAELMAAIAVLPEGGQFSPHDASNPVWI